MNFKNIILGLALLIFLIEGSTITSAALSVYDNFDNSDINTDLWNVTEIGTGAATETGGYIQSLVNTGASSSGEANITSIAFPDRNTVTNITIGSLVQLSTGSPVTQALSSFEVFGVTIERLFTTGANSELLQHNWTFNRLGNGDFHVLRDGDPNRTITPTNNNITITTKASGGTSEIARARMYYVNYSTNVPTVNLISPSNNSNHIGEVSFNSSIEAGTEENLANATLYIWNSANMLFVTRVNNISGTGTNFSLFNSGALGFGYFTWNVFGCATDGICIWGNENRSITSGFNISTNTFNEITTEGSSQDFILNLTYNNSFSITPSASLVYNGSYYTASSVSQGSNISFYYSLDIPNYPENSNVSFFWDLGFSNSTSSFYYNTSTYTQEVRSLSIDTCSSNTISVLNFTIRDEKTQLFLTNASMEVSINIKSESGNPILNISGNYSNPTIFCLNTNFSGGSEYLMDVVNKYSNEDDEVSHVIEYYNILNYTLNESSLNQRINLFDLDSSQSTDFRLTFTGTDYSPVDGALVYVDRQYISENTFKTVEIPLTDSNGESILHLVRNDVLYNLRMVKDGIVVGNFERITAFCDDIVVGDCVIELNALDSTGSIFQYSDLGIFYTGPDFTNSSREVSFSFTTVDGSSSLIQMEVLKSNALANRTLCSDEVESAGGTLTCNIGSASDSLITVNIYKDRVLILTQKLQISSIGYGDIGTLTLFVMIMSFVFMFSGSKTGVLMGVIVGVVSGILLGLMQGTILGAAASGMWIIVICLLGIWRLNKDRTQ